MFVYWSRWNTDDIWALAEWLDTDIGPYDYDTCEVCAKPLPEQTRGRPRATCSDRCRQIKRRRDERGWREPRQWAKDERRAWREIKRMEHAAGPIDDTPRPEWGNLSLRRRMFIRLERGIEPQWCKQCHKPYIYDMPGASMTYCSRKCQEAYSKNEKAVERAIAERDVIDPRVFVRRRLELPIQACEHCGTPFPKYIPKQKFCDDKCRNAAWYATHPKCERCGKRFSTKGKHPHKQFCSRQCKDAAWDSTRRRRRAKGFDRSPRVCQECGETFTMLPTSPKNRKYCGADCRSQAKERMRKQRKAGLL